MTIETKQTIEEQVHAAAHWLDEVKPGWSGLVDLSTLMMYNTETCVLGQVFHNEAKNESEYKSGWAWKKDRFGDKFADAFAADSAEPQWITEITLRV